MTTTVSPKAAAKNEKPPVQKQRALRHRFEVYLQHVGQWKTEFGTVRSIDLRFKDQVVVK